MGEHHPAVDAAEAQRIAERTAEAMWARDRASQELGMRVVAIAPGMAKVSMQVRPGMLNGHDICHGGFIFTLADSAFAFASNTYNRRALAQHCTISFLSPGKLGDRLIAKGIERHRAGRSGLYDITVTRDDGTVIAELRGQSRLVEGTLLPD